MNAPRAKTQVTAARSAANPAADVAAHLAPDLAADPDAALPTSPAAGLAAGAWLRPLTGHWTAAAYAHLSLHAALVRITVLNLRGSAPREPGASMLVDARGTVGTIGGGQLEWHATAAARELLQDRVRTPVRILDLLLGPELGQCCGGRVELWLERLTRADLPWLEPATRRAAGRPTGERRELDLGLVTEVGGGFVSHRLRRSLPGAPALEIRRRVSAETSAAPAATLLEVLTPRRPHLWIFGAGHVGQALVRVLAELALFDITWIDSRAHLLAPGLPHWTTRATAAPAALVGSARPATHYVVMTHDHGLDYDLCRAILRRGDAASLGLIGSASKAARFRSRLLREGFDREQLSGLTCPIGVPGITSKLPAAIAIAIGAELLQRHTAASASAPAVTPVAASATVTVSATATPSAPVTVSAPAVPVTVSAPAVPVTTTAAQAHPLPCSGECGSCGSLNPTP